MSGQTGLHQMTPLKPADFHILMVLLERERHGYGIMKAVREQSNGKVVLGLGSLYRLINRMMKDGLIEESPGAGDRHDRRKNYRITDAGRRAAREEALRLAEVLRVAQAHDLLKRAET